MTGTLRRSVPQAAGAEAVHALDDELDRRIAYALVADGRCTLRELSELTGLSISAVQARVHRLTTDGVIRGYTAILDPDAIGLPLAALVAITPLDVDDQDDIPARLAALPQIESCHATAGGDSFMLFVRAASITALEEVLREIRGVANVSTHATVILHTFFERRTATRS
jgi:Lrp/AsnC family leucine-responsive transcriptional regulator